MRTTAALAITGMREVLSQRLLYGVLVFAVGFTLASLALVHLTIGQWERLITDMGISSIGIASSMVAILVGAGLISREMERKTLYFVLFMFDKLPYQNLLKDLGHTWGVTFAYGVIEGITARFCCCIGFIVAIVFVAKVYELEWYEAVLWIICMAVLGIVEVILLTQTYLPA